METELILSMNGGCGEETYAENYKIQTAYLSRTMPVLHAALLDFSTKKLPATVTIADLGCSSGPNTLLAISESMSIIHDRCRQFGRSPLQFLVFLNDLPSKDFNMVFKSLPKFQERMREENGQGFGPCCIAGVPGSFYGRLFSSTSLHWLSQVPLELSNRSNKALVNEGKIYISRTSPPGVAEAYLDQSRRDFSSIRAFEMSTLLRIQPLLILELLNAPAEINRA
ncbi:probable methyltransferase TCM_000168 [Rhodamnia argentea]|uniref:Probable methyltransferase TCM_000168 n=1 Tax=Rhodamnia argentea TaxID=178133 RepID=A0A8B8PNS9_9MYRT|nr:probable methyltransferase TCM_000168 [Rhodamnia argentea]